MKRIGNLFDKIATLDNLYLAYEKAKKNKSRNIEIKKFEKNKDKLLLELQSKLINNQYKTSEYHTFVIYEPKERIIYKLPFYPDRIVHHAIMNILEPIWTSIFIKNTYSCIKNRGIHRALCDVRKDLKDINNTKYCLKLDIRKFYPNIDHTILKQIIRKKIKDIKLLNLLDEIIDSTDGVPIGNYLSQFFANLFLAYFDHYIKENIKVRYYYRYADDIVILHGNKQYLHNIFNIIKCYLSNMKLDIKNNYQIFNIESRGISFVGYVIYHNKTKLRKNIKQNLCRAAKRKYTNFEEYRKHLCSYIGWLSYCNSTNLSYKILDKRLLKYLDYKKRY